jgi:hypothetical protein
MGARVLPRGALFAGAGLVLLLFAAPLAAQDTPAPKPCLHNGQMLEHGTRVGHLVCNDGHWVPG